ASIGAVTGADILKAIAISGNADSNNSTIEKAKNAASIAIAKVENSKTLNAVNKDAVIAAGIALRAMAKDGKFSAKNEDKAEHAVNGAVSSAVNKTLSTLIIAIRNTVDSGLKTISKALAAVKQEDESTDATVSGQ
ncbi:Variable outer membrane protein, partial (plasmid) [Borrelia coriaceae ATCC 43381]